MSGFSGGGGAAAGVASFHGRSGIVALDAADFQTTFGFVPCSAVHTHPISDVVGLQGELDGKQATGPYLTGIDSALVTGALGYTPVPPTRSISTTAPLSGGGDFSGNLTLTISVATTGAAGSMSAADKSKLDAITGTNTGDQATITGNAGSASILQNARNFSITGKATAGAVSFDGSGNVALNVTAVTLAAGDIPTIAQSQVTNLTADLLAKAPVAAPAFTGAVTTTGSLGFATGAGGTATQSPNKTSGVTVNKAHGRVTMANTALAAATIVVHTLTNSTIAATDQVICSHVSGGTSGAYTINAFPGSGSAVVSVRNNTAGSLSDAIVYRFTVIKGVDA